MYKKTVLTIDNSPIWGIRGLKSTLFILTDTQQYNTKMQNLMWTQDMSQGKGSCLAYTSYFISQFSNNLNVDHDVSG